VRITTISVPKLIANDIIRLQADRRTFYPQERVGDGTVSGVAAGHVKLLQQELAELLLKQEIQSLKT